jgi:4-amino-4-deoxy-L-arabinose transferase-like glycosyltransferase
MPAWLVVLPVAMSASYVSARMALRPDGSANYWPALGLWLGAMALFVASFLPLRALALPRLSVRRPTWSGVLRSEALLVLALTATALVLRTVKLGDYPPLVHVDEEAIGYEALLAVKGQLKNMFSVSWAANPTMGFFLYGVFVKFLGGNIVAVRVASAVWGAAAVPVVYLLLREMFGRGPALVGAVFLLGFHLHLHFSRVAVNVIWDTPLVAAALYFAFRASRDQRPFDFAAAGLISGLGLYLYHGTRVVPLLVVAYLAWVCLFQRGFLRANLGNLSLAVLAFFLAAMPMGAYFLTHQHAFWARIGDAGIFQSGWFEQQQHLGRSAISILWDQTVHAFGAFVYYPESSPFTLYARPIPIVAGVAVVPFIAGFVYSLLHLNDRRYALLLLAFTITTVLGGVLTLGTTNGQRLMGTVPSIVAFVAVGLWQLGDRLLFWRRALVGPLAVAAGLALAAINAQIYFEAAGRDLQYGGVADTGAARYVKTLPREARVYWFGAPLISASFSPLSLHDHHLIEVFESLPERVTPVEEPSPSAYVFLPHRESELPPLQAKCPGGNTREIFFHGRKILTSYELLEPNTCVPDVAPPDNFEQARVISSLPVVDFTATYHLSVQPGEPEACGLTGGTLWYSFTSPVDSTLVVDTNGSGFDTVLAVYTGNGLDSLTLVGCNDDFYDVRSRVGFSAKKGRTYYFQVGASFKAQPLANTELVRFNLQNG